MAVELFWTPQAEDDLLEIYTLVALENPAAADRLIEKLESGLALLSHHPRLCQRRPEIRPSVRVLTEWPYLVLYETHPDTNEGPVSSVEIVRIIDGRRDLSHLF
ncbi:MAG: type II toxin-antitoxin system RelE/ParE family toxin [Acidobacteriaceae bacterium]|jgi:toxin ParE1/3/4